MKRNLLGVGYENTAVDPESFKKFLKRVIVRDLRRLRGLSPLADFELDTFTPFTQSRRLTRTPQGSSSSDHQIVAKIDRQQRHVGGI